MLEKMRKDELRRRTLMCNKDCKIGAAFRAKNVYNSVISVDFLKLAKEMEKV